MDWNAILAIVAVLGFGLGVIGLIRDSRQDKRASQRQQEQDTRRITWERDQERKRQEWEQRQVDAAAPHPKPVGAAWHGLTDTPLVRLMADAKQQDVELHNVGKSTPVEVVGVLFGARVMNPQSRILTDNLYGTYWGGSLSVSPAPDGRTHLLLDNEHYPLVGEQSVIDGLTLFAPDEPILSPTKSTGPNLFARLTMTYRDAYGRTLALVYDAEAVRPDASKIEWRRAAGPTEVSKSLQELIDETRRRRDQGQNPF